MKTIVGKEYRKEGKDGERLYTVIQCCDCGAKTYERKQDKIKQALERGCNHCKHLASTEREEQRRIQFQQDSALLAMLRSIQRLIPKPDKRIKHGCNLLDRRTANIYRNMVDRCYNPRAASYEHYGGHGITVCQRWLDDIRNFFTDMGVAPEGYSLERHDVNGNYEPMNCSWIPKEQPSRNRRCSYRNRGIFDPKDFRRRKVKALAAGSATVHDIPFANRKVGWWRQFGLYHNPYVYGPMPWKRTSRVHRRDEAIQNGWHQPKSQKK